MMHLLSNMCNTLSLSVRSASKLCVKLSDLIVINIYLVEYMNTMDSGRHRNKNSVLIQYKPRGCCRDGIGGGMLMLAPALWLTGTLGMHIPREVA